jgi:hypothetical protein
MSDGVSIPAAAIPILASTLGVISITVPYIVAVTRGDKQWGLYNLPDITHCVLDMPERGIFYVLFMPAISFQAMSWVLMWHVTRVASALGVVAAWLLILGESMLDPHPNFTVHIIGASGFFLVSMVAAVLRAYGGRHETSRSLRSKRVLASLNVGLVIADTAFGGVNAPGWADHLMEWMLAWTSLLYVASFASDLRGYRIKLLPPAPTGTEGLLGEVR